MKYQCPTIMWLVTLNLGAWASNFVTRDYSDPNRGISDL